MPFRLSTPHRTAHRTLGALECETLIAALPANHELARRSHSPCLVRHWLNTGGRLLVAGTLAAGLLSAAKLPIRKAQAAPRLATYTVTHLNDSGPGSLRQAILDANADTAPDFIHFDSTLNGILQLTSGSLVVSQPVEIVGPGPEVITITTVPGNEIFNVYNPGALIDVTISGLTIAGSTNTGIRTQAANLVLDTVVITGNSSNWLGGGIFAYGGYGNLGSLTVRDSVISNNSAQNGGGGLALHGLGEIYIESTQILTNSTVTSDSLGGSGIMADSSMDLTLVDSILSGNTSPSNGGGLSAIFPEGSVEIRNTQILNNQGKHGAGLSFLYLTKPVTITESTISGNVATGRGGGIAANAYPGYPLGTLTIQNSLISGNTSQRGGGGMWGVTLPSILIQDSQVEDNNVIDSDASGGGIATQYCGEIGVIRSTISGNSAPQEGGGLHIGASNGPLTIRETLISANTSDEGGGIALVFQQSPVTIENSTISGNTVTSDGGAVQISGSGTNPLTLLRHTTIASNQVQGVGVAGVPAGGLAVSTGLVRVENSIIADNASTGVNDLAANLDGSVELVSSLVEVKGQGIMTETLGTLVGQDPFLAPLADNGGLTLTHQPGAASPVIDAGQAPTGLTTDQRGAIRPAGAAADMGAVELQFGAIQFQSAEIEVQEDAGSLTIPVERIGGSEGAVTVTIQPANGTADAQDFLIPSPTLTWLDSEGGTKNLTVQIQDDTLEEPAETLSLNITAGLPAALVGSPSQTTVTIQDNDPPPSPGVVAFVNSEVTVNEGSGPLNVMVARSGGASGSVSVHYRLNASTPLTGTLTWATGDAEPKIITVPLPDNARFTGPQTLQLHLSDPTGGASLGNLNVFTILLLDDEFGVFLPFTGRK